MTTHCYISGTSNHQYPHRQSRVRRGIYPHRADDFPTRSEATPSNPAFPHPYEPSNTPLSRFRTSRPHHPLYSQMTSSMTRFSRSSLVSRTTNGHLRLQRCLRQSFVGTSIQITCDYHQTHPLNSTYGMTNAPLAKGHRQNRQPESQSRIRSHGLRLRRRVSLCRIAYHQQYALRMPPHPPFGSRPMEIPATSVPWATTCLTQSLALIS